MAESADGSWLSCSFMWHARGPQVPIKSPLMRDVLDRGTSKRKTGQPESSSASKRQRKKETNFEMDLGFVEPLASAPLNPGL